MNRGWELPAITAGGLRAAPPATAIVGDTNQEEDEMSNMMEKGTGDVAFDDRDFFEDEIAPTE
ncbi:hypothetical protein Rleg5DRAFT_5331 [Rhizobium leguminosarum bv. viciae WSM1455]|nr:hypothetical protein Rleg5DRAFT_5331 [Rhizobium leguminosarum bv. viciae WSM1455]